MSFESVEDIFLGVCEVLEPAEELSVSQAAEKYRYVNQPGAYVGPWMNATTPMMVEPMDEFTSREHNGIIFVGAAQTGKPIDITTPVPTPDGWKALGDIVAGDKVFNDHGEPVDVVYCTETFHNRECFRITFDDDTHIISDGVHRWSVNDMRACDPYAPLVLDTNSLHGSYKVITSRGTPRFRYSIPVAGALQLPAQVLPVDPYVLGLWLGDGNSHCGAMTFGSKDYRELIAHVLVDTEYRVFSILDDNERGTSKRVQFRGPDDIPLKTLLTRAGVMQNKSIPPVYLRASFEQRLELLRGLMDTDGYVSEKGRIQFSQSRKALFDQVVELVRSLGIKPMLDSKVPYYTYKGVRRTGAMSYRLSFSVDDSTTCFKLTRQLNRYRVASALKTRRPTHSLRRFIRDITPVASVPVRCISVDDTNHLFLVGEQMVPTHNTDALILNTIAYTIKVEPMDTMIVHPTMTAARDFSTRRLDRLHRHSEEIGAMMMPGADFDNKFDKQYRNGMLLTLSWPTPTELAGKPIGRIVMTDFDRMPMDVGPGDGNPYDLASKRTTTFGSYAMCLAESSPSKPVTDSKFIPRTPHEAPPCEGILALYNRGDRRRWYWPCLGCDQYFEGNFKHLTYEKRTGQTNLEVSETVRMKCPYCGHDMHVDDRDAMQARGRWVKDGQGVGKDGIVFGPQQRTSIASFWLNGMAAVFTNWKKLVALYLDADDEYERTGSQEALRKFYNTDLAEPYYEKGSQEVRLPETLKARAEPLRERFVPTGVRFLLALVDVQQNMWIVQVMGILPGAPFDTVVIDRFEVKYSKRLNEAGERLWVKPSTYEEDWDELTEHVLEKEYPLDDDSGRMMSIKMVGCDSGGKAGVTGKAYAYYRKLREQNKHRRFILVKGDGKPGNPRCRITFPDSNQRDKLAVARGDVPVLLFNSNLLKDDLNGRLDCLQPMKGMFRTPDWLSDKFYAELCAEFRGAKGWENPAQHRNESWDLSYYCIGVAVSELVRVEGITWSNPPSWASDWTNGGSNDFVRTPEEESPFANTTKPTYNFADFGKALG